MEVTEFDVLVLRVFDEIVPEIVPEMVLLLVEVV